MTAPPRSAHEVALRLLESKRRTRRELERALVAKRFDAPEIADALDRLERVGLVDDLEYARAYLRERLGRQAVGARALRAKLTLRGIPPAVADAALAELAARETGEGDPGVASEVERAGAALRQIERRYAALDPRERRRRLSAALARRGFDWETIEAAIHRRTEEESGTAGAE